MTFRRSPIALLCALVAVLAMPAAASAFASAQWLLSGVHASAFAAAATDCVDPDNPPAGGDPDVTAPVNTTPAAPAGWQTSAYTVALTGTDSESGVDHMQWCVDGGTAANVVPGGTILLDQSGVYTLITRAKDVAGNASAWRAETVSIDLSAPSDVTDSGTVNWTTTTRTVTVSAVDPVSGVDHVEWQLDGGVVHTDPNDTDVTISADGSHTLRTRAVDVAGNVSAWRDHTIKVDSVDPIDETAAPGGWQRAALGVTVAGADAHSGIASVTYDLDGTQQTVPAASTTVNVSGDGDHTLTTYVTDNAGNQSAPKTTTIRIDTTAPANTTPTAGSSWRGADYAVMVNGADDGSGLRWVEWRVDGGPVTRGVAPLQATVAGNGTHVFETRAIDVAGNASGWRTENVKIDKVDPANTTTTPAPEVSNPYTVAVTGTDADSGISLVKWRVDGVPYSGAPGSIATVSGAGTHTLETMVVDAAGRDSGWRTDTVTINIALNNDTTAPVDTTDTAPAGWTNEDVDLALNGTDAGSGMQDVRVRQDGTVTPYTLPHTLPLSAEGEYYIETQARDLAGNTSNWRPQWVRIDKSPPTDATDVAAGWSNSTEFTLSATDALSGVASIEYTINSGSVVSAADGDTVNVPGDGTFKIMTRALDRAGTGTPWKTSWLRVDRVLPVNSSAVPSSAWSADPLSLNLTGTDSGSGLDKMQWRLDGGAIQDGGPAVVDTDGVHTLETHALDAAGNASVWRSDTVRVDLTAPVNTTPAAPAGWISTPYSVTVTGDDGAGSGVDTLDVTVDGATSTPNVTISADGVHTIESRITDNVGHETERTDTVRIDSIDPTATLSCTSGWTRAASCTPTAGGGPSGVAGLTLATDGGTPAAVTAGQPVAVSTDGVHTLSLRAVDGAGNEKTVSAQVKVDRTIPTVSLSCAAATTPTGYVCRASGSDARSGLSRLAYSVNGGAWTTVPSSGTFTVASGTVRAYALDAAGNQALTSILTLAARTPPVVAPPPPVTLRTATAPVYLAGRNDADGMVGAVRAARSATGTVSVDLRPLAVGRGRYRVAIVLKSGKHERTVTRTYKVGRDGTLRRMAVSLAHATGTTTVTLTVRKKHGKSWRKHAVAKVVLAK